MTGRAIAVQADASRLPLPDDSVDLIVTSPPYFALRSYTDDGAHYDGQIGSEPTWQEFIASLVDVTRECVRVLKPSGSLFVNLGDKYAQDEERSRNGLGQRNAGLPNGAVIADETVTLGRDRRGSVPRKSLMLLPERYRIACVDELGLIARSVIVWSKPNGLPESVTDRVRRSHEDWVHLTLRPRYYSAVDEIRVEHVGPWKSPGSGRPSVAVGPQNRNGHSQWDRTREERDETVRHPLGALPGSVWTIPTEPLKLPADLGVDHFAAFPSEWPRRLILGWSPPGICVECGEGRRPVAEHTEDRAAYKRENGLGDYMADGKRDVQALGARRSQTNTPIPPGGKHQITGYTCACPTPDAPTRPAVVLDPFGGTGTTAAVAEALGRTGVSVDLSHDYSRVARWRATDPALAAKVQGRVWKERQGTLDLGGVA